MKLKPGIISFAILATIQLSIWVPLNAAVYDVSDVALTPGQDITQLNIAWHHSDNECNCIVEIAEKPDENKQNDGKSAEFPEDSREFHGTNEFIGLDENSVVTYACEVTVSGLENQANYTYRLGNDQGEWSNIYEYATRDEKRYGFFFVADSQIGASGPNARSGAMKAYIAEYQIRKTCPDLSDEDVKVLVNACTNNTPADTFLGLTELKEAVDLLYDSFSKDTTDKLFDLKGIDPELAKEILALQMASAEEDSKGWAETVRIMTENFPEAAFILSGGDQVELKNREYEYTGFFSAPELTSLPVAPAIADHEEGINFDYHFNLPNESSEYGVDSTGGDYYFSYGDALFMVLNMDATKSEFPQNSPPDQGGGPQGGSSPPPGQGGGPQGGSSPPPGQGGMGQGGGQGGPSPPSGQGGSPPPGGPSSPPGQNMDRAASGGSQRGPAPPGRDASIDSEEEFKLVLSKLEEYCDEETGECYDKLESFKNSVDEHKTFMKEAIAANPDAKWKVVMWHYSIYSTGNHATDDVIRAIRYYMVPVLDDLDVDVVLLGHDHCFTRTHQMLGDDPQLEQKVDQEGRIINPTGILYLTANSSSGSKYYGLHSKYDVTDNPDTPDIEGPDPYFEYVAVAEQMRKPLFSYIVVDNDSFEISTYTTDTMEMIDRYAIVKE